MKKTFHDLASLAARMGVGGIFFANGWHKLEAGLTATAAQFTELHAPVPGFWAAATMLIELVGGTLLIAGLAVPAVGLLLFAEAVAVFVLTAGDTGLPLTGGDIELVVALGAASVLLAVGGGGRISVDHMVVIKRREAEAADDFAAEAEADAVIAALREPAETRPAASASPAAGPPSPAPAATPRKESPSGPVTFPAATPPAAGGKPAETEAAAAKTAPRPRRTKRGDGETTESRSEAPPGTGQPGDTLVAGRRPGAKTD
ncbi:DoxX family protein [Microbispora sp. ATCC PTA-5024]|uniref:DoxX family protein n=1 Tax=Microbispora sp. ATCC PTA-5024 TaxID=316330 RepID=UPI0003DC3D6E|nr:DoxX family protein [Microbispora sp. ATCC PTA-5024]ETK32170.1 hypothetical protein MPTA5024_31085 [Microbispora sp. ATCC PTA-5024]